MADDNTGSAIVHSWDKYWQGSEHGQAYSSSGTSHPLVLSFWHELFAVARDRYEAPYVIDIASGSGAVVDCARSVLGQKLAGFTCLDISPAAISTVTARYPDVQGIVADARSIPLESARYHIATSQFGIEYAGLDAVPEVCRLITAGGQLAFLLHHRAGGIYRQCAASLDAITRLQEARIFPLAIPVFEAGFAACRGADRSHYEAAVKNFAPAVRTMESVLMQHGRHVADGTVARIYQDIRTMHERLPNYDPREVLDWLHGMQGELDAYAGRMASMCNAAIDARAFDGLCNGLRSQHFDLERAGALVNPEHDVPLAWALVALRRQNP